MPVTRPCIVGTMGSTKYYETTMTGRELASSVRPAKESDQWTSDDIEERMQREFNTKRIKDELAPYLAQHEDRFFGSIIVLVPDGSIEFEPLEDIVTQPLKAAYRESAKQIGFLTIDKGELIALDGQHRLLAFREVVGGGITGDFAGVVGDDEVCVIFIEFQNSVKTRRIFNKVNRHAKPTGRSDNIITSEDDGNAIVARRLLGVDAVLANREINGQKEELVDWRSNTLGQHSRRLTTLSAVYDTVKDILTEHNFEGFDDKKAVVAPPAALLDSATQLVTEWWEAILDMQVFKDALADMASVAEARYDGSNKSSLLLRPVGQVAFVKGLLKAVARSEGKLTVEAATKRADKIDWSTPATSIWTNTIVKPDQKMVARREVQELAGELVAYLIGAEFMTEDMRHDLWRMWNKARGKDTGSPVDEIEDESLIPEDLPEPLVP